MLPLTTFCVLRILVYSEYFLEHHVTRQQTITEKGIITFKDNSRVKLSRFFAKFQATCCCT